MSYIYAPSGLGSQEELIDHIFFLSFRQLLPINLSLPVSENKKENRAFTPKASELGQKSWRSVLRGPDHLWDIPLRAILNNNIGYKGMRNIGCVTKVTQRKTSLMFSLGMGGVFFGVRLLVVWARELCLLGS